MIQKKKRRHLAARRFWTTALILLLIGGASYGVLSGVTFVMKAMQKNAPVSGDRADIPKTEVPDTSADPATIDPDLPIRGDELAGKTFCIDPGHGYSDGGAISPLGSEENLMEKKISLSIGLELEKLLKAAGAKVVMTRSDDFKDDSVENPWKKLSLDERCRIGNDCAPDLFVSLHCDSFVDDPTIGGGTLYYFDGKERDETEILHHLEMIAGALEKKVQQIPKIERQSGVSAFQVIRKIDAPAMLFEVGFITNPKDAQNMADEAWRVKIAQGIFEGICASFASL